MNIPSLNIGGRWSLFLSVLLLSVSLMSCSQVVRQQSEMPPDWEATHARHQAFDDWRVSARMAVQTPETGGSLDMHWKQTGDAFDIRLIAPLGQGAMRLQGTPSEVIATTADGERISGTPEALLQANFGFSLPVEALIFWLRGIAYAADYSQASWNEQGRLHQVQQLGWRVEMREYSDVSGHQLPQRFYLETDASGETHIRFSVSRWSAL